MGNILKDNNLKQHIEALLKNTKFSDEKGILFVNKILEAIETIDTDLVEILIKDDKAKKHFFSKVLDTFVMNQFKLIDFFSMNNYFEESYTSYTNKIGLIRKDDFIKKNNDVVLAFPYKDCVLEGGQTKDEQKGKENFFNEILDSDEIDRLFEPKVLTNIKRYTKDGVYTPSDTKGWHSQNNGVVSDTDNLILKGNNLLALHSLKKKYAGKVKLIYIDPPYNTGNDSFKYNDNFNHSTWLTFMKNRLEVARELLRDDGVIFVQIDNKPTDFNESPELGYLLVLLDDVFGRKNYIGINTWKKKGNASNTQGNIGTITESIIMYAQDFDSVAFNLQNYKRIYKYEDKLGAFNLERPIKTNSGAYERKTMQFGIKTKEGVFYPPSGKRWTIGEDTAISKISECKYLIKDSQFYLKKYPEDYLKGEKTLFNNLFDTHGSLKTAKDELSKLGFDREDFDSPKPECLIERIIKMSTAPNDLVLDFFVGSGTTCAVAHKMGRQYIGIEQMDYIQDITVERMKKVIDGEQGGISKSVNWQDGGDFVYAELKQVANFDNSNSRLKQEMRYLPIGELEDKDYQISKEEIEINKAFYGVNDE